MIWSLISSAVILSQSEGLHKMALGIVKYAYDRSSQLIDVIWFAVSCRGPQQHGNIV